MGNAADDRLTENSICKKLGGSFRFASEDLSHHLDRMIDQADDLRQRDSMDQQSALEILSGKSRAPYGSVRRR